GTSVRGPDHVITDWPISDHEAQSNNTKIWRNWKYYFLTSLLTTSEICE
ncbi:unnamed protein product, partial [Staurois parvus]